MQLAGLGGLNGLTDLAVLVRFSCLGFWMPPELRSSLSDPRLEFTTFGWGPSDEDKMQLTFGVGRDLLHSMTDVRQVAKRLGYGDAGLPQLAQHVLGYEFAKPRKVRICMSASLP
ncbi:hypothetical protein ABPG75_004856 [Micractinium tetrahymenae]